MIRSPLGSARCRGVFSTFAALASLLLGHRPAASGVGDYQYLSPVPDARLVQVRNNVIIRYGKTIDLTTITPGAVTVVGEASGVHDGTLDLADDGETILFTPSTPFAPDERVTVTLGPGVKAVGNVDLPSLSFAFSTAPPLPSAPAPRGFLNGEIPAELLVGASTPTRASVATGSCDLPANYPTVTLIQSDDPEPGFKFLGPFGFGTHGQSHLLILDDRANPIFWRALPGIALLDFKQVAGGRLGYVGAQRVYLLDSTYAVIDSFAVGNGYLIDGHDFQILPNGHALVMMYDAQPVRMDSVVVGGRPDAIVTGLVVQELDAQHRVVFQWRSWDAIPITDCASASVSLTDSLIDYIHGNAVELDADGNLLISGRHTNEITKIDRRTGRILWRFAPNGLQNQFAVANDPRGFSHQHDIRRLPNGDISLFDNGNFLSPTYSRGVEYQIDEVAMTASKVWEYRTVPDTYGPFMGNVQLLPGGGRMIGWGGSFASSPRLTEVHEDGSTAFSLTLPNNTWTYRAYSFPWQTPLLSASETTLDYGTVPRGVPLEQIIGVFLTNRGNRPITINCMSATHPAFTTDHVVPFTLAPGQRTELDVTFNPNYPGDFDERLYVRSVSPSEIVGTVFRLRARTAPSADVGHGPLAFRLRESRPNPFQRATTFRFDLPRPARVVLDVLDLHGRRVATAVDGTLSAGPHEIEWKAPALPAGVYLCRLRAGGLEATQKLVRIR